MSYLCRTLQEHAQGCGTNLTQAQTSPTVRAMGDFSAASMRELAEVLEAHEVRSASQAGRIAELTRQLEAARKELAAFDGVKRWDEQLFTLTIALLPWDQVRAVPSHRIDVILSLWREAKAKARMMLNDGQEEIEA
jgi:hypothetical protein